MYRGVNQHRLRQNSNSKTSLSILLQRLIGTPQMSLKKKDKPAGKKDRGSDRRHGSGPSSMQLPEPPNLEEELRSIWHKDVNDTPVYKDLPRLARRIVILGSLKPVESKEEDDKKKEDKKPKINSVKIGATLLEYTIYLNTSPITSAR